MHLRAVRDLFRTDVDLNPVAFPTTHVPARLLANRTLGNPVGPTTHVGVIRDFGSSYVPHFRTCLPVLCRVGSAMPCSFCGHYIPYVEGKRGAKRYARHYLFTDRYETDMRIGSDGSHWVQWQSGPPEQIYWYTPSELSGLLWFLECDRCKSERQIARRRRDELNLHRIMVLRQQLFEEREREMFSRLGYGY